MFRDRGCAKRARRSIGSCAAAQSAVRWVRAGATALRCSRSAGPLAVRRFTPRECERLQGMPDDYTLDPVSREARCGRPAVPGDWKFDGGAGDAVDRPPNSDGGRHSWLKPASRPPWRGESNCGRSSGWCRTPGMRGRIPPSRWRRLRRASWSSVSTIRSWWTPTPASSPGTGDCWPRGSWGWSDVPVVVLDHLSETQTPRIHHRRQPDWRERRVGRRRCWRRNCGNCKADGLDLDLVGFSDDELARLLAEPNLRQRRRPPDGRGDPRGTGRAGNAARRRLVDRKAPADLRRLPRPRHACASSSTARGRTW